MAVKVQPPVSAASGGTSVTVQAGSYTLAAGDANTVVRINSASASVVTVPPNSSVAFPVGTIIEVTRAGAGTVTVAAGAGVTVNSRSGLLAIANQYSAASLLKVATDSWTLVGDLA